MQGELHSVTPRAISNLAFASYSIARAAILIIMMKQRMLLVMSN